MKKYKDYIKSCLPFLVILSSLSGGLIYQELKIDLIKVTFLTLSMLIKKLHQKTLWNIFLIFSGNRFDISCKLSPFETICFKCQFLFSGKNQKNIDLSSTEL